MQKMENQQQHRKVNLIYHLLKVVRGAGFQIPGQFILKGGTAELMQDG